LNEFRGLTMRNVAKNAPKSPYLKRTYSEDMIMALDTPFKKKCAAVGLLISLLFPFVVSNYFIHIANLIAIASISALALNLLCGNAGLLSLGHAGFMASGAFTTAIMVTHFGMPFWVVLPTSAIVGAILGFIAGLPSLRLKGMYLGLSTLAIHYVIVYVISEYQFYGGFGFGITIKDPEIGGFVLSDDKVWYFVLYFIVWVVAVFTKNLLRSRPGRAWIAIHNRDIAAEIMGINAGYYKILAFVTSTSITAIAGSIYAYYTNVASIDEYSFTLTIRYLAMIIIGGLGSILGSLLGAFLITSIPFFLIYIVDLLELTGPVKDFFFVIEVGLFGLVIIFFLLVEPLGLAEIWRRIRVYFQLWPFRYKPLTVTKR
jgi:branched-chain amino acid transport system permease protein